MLKFKSHQHLGCLLAVSCTLCTGPLGWLAHVAWLVVAIYCALDIRYMVGAIFFYSTFFIPIGFAQNFIFSVKHFHLIMVITTVIQLVRGTFWETLQSGLKGASRFAAVILIVAIALMSNLMHVRSMSAVRIGANLMLTFCSVVFLFGLIDGYLYRLKIGILSYIYGFSVQSVIGYLNDFAGTTFLKIQLIHNDHLGVFFAMTFFLCIPFAMTEKSRIKRWCYIFLASVIFAGLAYTCTRTAWVSVVVITAAMYVAVQCLASKSRYLKIFNVRFWLLGCLIVALLGHLLIATNFLDYAIERWKGILAPLHAYYWQYAMSDNNFGFFGIFRLQQFYSLKAILKSHLFFGVGFTNEVIGYHSLYFTILGASGITGMAVFVSFVYKIFRQYSRSIAETRSFKTLIVKVSVLASFAVWLLCSFMQTLLLQYAVWTNVLMVIYFAVHTNKKISFLSWKS